MKLGRQLRLATKLYTVECSYLKWQPACHALSQNAPFHLSPFTIFHHFATISCSANMLSAVVEVFRRGEGSSQVLLRVMPLVILNNISFPQSCGYFPILLVCLCVSVCLHLSYISNSNQANNRNEKEGWNLGHREPTLLKDQNADTMFLPKNVHRASCGKFQQIKSLRMLNLRAVKYKGKET